jgi:hypothetical protein
MDQWIIGNVILLIAALFTSVQIVAAAFKKISLHDYSCLYYYLLKNMKILINIYF